MPSLILEKNLINLQDKFFESIGVFSPHAPTPLEIVYHPTREKISSNEFQMKKDDIEILSNV